MNLAKRPITNGKARKRVPNNRMYLSGGYIAIPSGQNREIFIKNALRLERVSVLIENNSVLKNDCMILKSALKDIEFPEDSEGLGSGVAVLQEPYTGQVVVLGVVNKNDETELRNEYEISEVKTFEDKFVSVKGNAEKGVYSVDVSGSNDSAEINLNVRNNNGDAKLNLNVKGNVTITSENDISVTAEKGVFKINKGEESVLLGDKTQKQLDYLSDRVQKIIDAINNSAVAGGDGGATFKSNMIAILSTIQQKEDFSKIKSEKSFTD